MEVQMQQIQDMSKEIENRPVWDSFGDESDDARFLSPAVNYRAMYHTTNSEYGRFQPSQAAATAAGAAGEPCRVPTADAVSRSLELLGASRPLSQRDPSADARTRAAELEFNGSGNWGAGNGGDTGRAPSTCGVRLPSLGKYMPLKGTAVGDGNDDERRRLTTGYAKSYMRQSHGPFWNNIQTVAEGAGFNTSASGAQRPDTNVLTIDRAGGQEYGSGGAGDVEYDEAYIAELMAGIKADTSVTPRPNSAASSAKFGDRS